MAVDSKRASGFVALSRFGYGARGSSDDLIRAASDPRAFLKAELELPGAGLLTRPSLPTTKTALQALFAEQERVRLQREEKKTAQADEPGKKAEVPAKPSEAPSKMEPSAEMSAGNDMQKPAPAKPVRAEPPVPQQLFRADAHARFEAAAAADAGFVERLVQFWSNHFCVSAAKGGLVRAAAGSFEREAIRPHVLGRFSDMLRAVAGHPAMLAYLDNAQSFGPNSVAGQRRNRGLNENLAREILELHTLGVDAGYTQADVTSLARILTGWTFAGREGRIGEPGEFAFFPNGHEPGDHALLGKVYKAGGIEQGEAALADLARHPATSRHIARKFAAHFVADEPAPVLVERLAKSFSQTHGDLKALAVTLLDSDEAWSSERTKLRSPHEFLMATVRAVGRVPEEPGLLLGPLVVMGMPLWQPPGPNGWPGTVAAWATPKGMKSRLDISAAVAARLKDSLHPAGLLEATLGEAATRETRQAVARAESRHQGLALLLMSPEFQWR
jgi:uncharacterized protein (DUF1800 family)